MNNIYINIDNMWPDVPEELIIFQGSSIWNRQPWLGAWRVRTVAWQEIHGSMGYLSCSSCSCTDHSKLKYNSKMMQNGFGSFGFIWNFHQVVLKRPPVVRFLQDPAGSQQNIDLTPGYTGWPPLKKADMASLWKALRSLAEDGEAGARRAGSVELFLFLNVLLGVDPFVWFVDNIYGITGPWYEIPSYERIPY